MISPDTAIVYLSTTVDLRADARVRVVATNAP